MQLTWYGHACFLIQNEAGQRVLTDPYDPDTGFTLSDLDADVVTVSHAHHDHNYLAAVSGHPAVVSQAGTQTFGELRITGFPSWHDGQQGKLRGPNLMFLFETDGLRILHAGDLGHLLDAQQRAVLGRVDVLLCPVGGTYTLDAAQAVELLHALDPCIFIPMHYAIPGLNVRVEGVDLLLQRVKDYRVHRLNDCTCTVSADSLGVKRVLVLNQK